MDADSLKRPDGSMRHMSKKGSLGPLADREAAQVVFKSAVADP
jgi:hypothetical protein